MESTPAPARKSGFFVAPSPFSVNFSVPRPDRRRSDARWIDGGSSRSSRDKEAPVQVIVRCRPLTDKEQKLNVSNIISCNEDRREVTVLQSATYKQVDKVFTFDKVFGPESQQRTLYDQAISPIVKEVLKGFNCTIFAYGQTGTGKTYTMEGEINNQNGELLEDAGVIPRAVQQIFDTLEDQNADYSMKVTFLELYNEEVTDLLTVEEHYKCLEDRQKNLITLMEDGKGGVIVRGLEELVVYSAREIHGLLDRVLVKRRNAETLSNKHSSRSHSVFSITIHVRESVIGNGELIKCGKLNLVDLAGSENILKTDAREGRAREAGEINKSLLTLRRVITALVECSTHVPYRDSKLTRLLQDSLGGKTQTCIIATVSPAAHCLEETLSTLDLAFRAKSIKNKPEVNQKLFKSVLLKDLHKEIDKLKQDVRAAREKNGVYMTHDRFLHDETSKKAMSVKIEQIKSDVDLRMKDIGDIKELYLVEHQRNMDLEDQVKNLKSDLESAGKMLKEKEFIISNLLSSENLIIEKAKDLHAGLQNASEDVSLLFTKLDCKNRNEAQNSGLISSFRSKLDQSLEKLQSTVEKSVAEQHQQLRSMAESLGSFVARKSLATKHLESRLEKMGKICNSGAVAMKMLGCALEEKASFDLENLKLSFSAHKINVENFLVTAVSEAEQILEDIQSSLTDQKQLMKFFEQQQHEGLQKSLVSTQVISRTTIDFFHSLYRLSNNVVAMIEEEHMDRIRHLEVFEKAFQEEMLKEEKVALENVSRILSTLQTKNTNMISEAIRNIKAKSYDEKNPLHAEMFKMQNISNNAEACWNSYIEKIECQFQEDTSSAADTRSNMEKILDECTKKVGQTKQKWDIAQLFVDRHSKSFTEDMESAAEKGIHANKTLLEDFKSASSAMEADFGAENLGLQTEIKDYLNLDNEYEAQTESGFYSCFDQLKVMQNDHSSCIEDTRNLAENCLTTNYLHDEPNATLPARQAIMVPSLTSIEQLRTTSLTDLLSKMKVTNRLKEGSAESKQQLSSPGDAVRSPLTPLNQ